MTGSPNMRRLILGLLACLFVGAAAAAGAPPPVYPPAPRGPVVDHYFGTAVPDPYRWMEDVHDPALRKWVDAENRLVETSMAKNPLRPWIEKRLSEIWHFASET